MEAPRLMGEGPSRQRDRRKVERGQVSRCVCAPGKAGRQV